MSKKDTRPRLPLSSGSKEEWDDLIELSKIHTVKGILNKINGNYQDIEKLLKRKLKERPITVKRTKGVPYETWIVLGCIHRPHHNKIIWAKIMQLIKDLRKDITGIILNGDYLEVNSISSYGVGKKGSGITLMEEYEDGYEGLMDIESALGKRRKEVQKHFMYGNHEQRFNIHFGKLEIAKYGKALLNPVDGLKLDELGYQVQMDYQNAHVLLGTNLEVFHGHYFSQHAAHKHLKEAKGKSTIFNHTHRMQMFSDNKATAYNLGCLINLEDPVFNYASRFTRSNWKNGFGIVYIDKNGDHTVNPIECRGTNFWFGNKMY